MEKKLTSIEFRCSDEFKAQVDALAASLNIDRSEFVRAAVVGKIKNHRAVYEALHKVFSSETSTLSDVVRQDDGEPE